jgi:hypothetical protein
MVTRGRGIELLILELGTRWGSLDSITPRPRYTLGKRPPVPIGYEAWCASELVWIQKPEEKSFVTAGDRTPQSVDRHYTD